MTIAVTGATGHLGRLAIAALKARLPASEIVALVRDPAKAADLFAQLAEAMRSGLQHQQYENTPAAG